MKYISTNEKSPAVSFKEAVINGMPPDGGLYMPETITPLDPGFFDRIENLSRAEIGFEIARPFIEEEINPDTLLRLVDETINFDIPVVNISDNLSTLELFHGPTMAFKDVGARFMARCLGYFSKNNENETTVLVATSGDTGSAVAHGFYEVEGIKVVILYPKGKVSEFQEQQMTRLGKNITALEVDGTFDDCQHLVKSAFSDSDIKARISLTSANSINIARLIPQIFYYFFAYTQLGRDKMLISVPSGNYGNLTAGLLAMKLGLPVKKFIASSNRNDIVPGYLQTGEFSTRPSIQTISNAMDVGNPSNFARMLYLYEGSLDNMRNDIKGYSFTDEETKGAIRDVRDKYDYVLDPHGAVGYLGLRSAGISADSREKGIFLETAHPSKFSEVVEPVLNETIIPPEGYKPDQGPKLSIPLKNDLEDLKRVLFV